MKKKLLSVLMVLCLILAMAPAAMAEGETEVDSAEALTSALQVGGNIKLTNDITVETKQEWTIGSGISVVLDLNNHTISSSYDEINYYVMVVNGGSLTITDSSEDKGGKIVANDDNHGYGIQLRGTGSSFTLLGGTIETTQETLDIYTPANNTTVNISGGKLVSTADSVINVRGSGTIVNITGGEMTSDGRTGVYISNYGESDSILFTMTGGALTFSGASSGAIQAYKGATLTIGENATISSTSYAIQAQENTVVNVEGGTLSTTGSYTIGAEDTAEVNISGGKLTSPKYTITAEENAKINISGGDFTGGSQNFNIDEEDEESAVITVTGGTFKKTNGDADMSVGYYFPAHSDVSIDETTGIVSGSSESSVATVDGIGYSDFTNALSALKNGSTLTLRDSVSVTSQITIDEDNVTFDGGGFTISAGETFTGPDLMLVTGDSVTVKNVTLDGSSKAGYGVQFYEAGNATIQDVTAQNNTKNGIQVNASTVTASGKIELSNNGWGGGINVGYGQNIQSAPGCSFDITDATLVGVTAIYADAGDVERAEAASVDINVTVDGTDFVAVGDSGGISFVPESTIAGSAAIAVVAPDGTVTYYNNATSLQSAIDNAESGSTITLAPGTYEGNITFGGKSLTITAQHPAYSNGNYAADEDLSKFTGTFNTYGEDSGSFYPDQTIVIDGLALSGDGLKIGNNNYNSVGNLEVRHCTMELGSNLSNSSESNYAGLNYFVKVNGEPSDGNYASVIVEDNSIHGTAHDSISPVQLWDVDNAVVKNNVISMTGASSGYQAISISKMASDSTVEVTGNDITGIDGGIYITTWLLGGNTTDQAESFTGEITVSDNEVSGAGATMHPIFIGYESATGVPYGILGTDCDIVASGNTSDGTPVSPVIGMPENATAEPTIVEVTLFNGDSVVSVTSGTSPLTVNLPTLTNTGYTFVGWRSNIDSRIYNNTYSATADVTLTAVWRVVESDTPDVKPVGPTYDIDVVDAENGSVSANLSNASEGSTIRLTVEPDEGYELGSLTVTGPDGRVEVTRVNASTYRFTMPDGDVTVRATFVSEGLPFTDVSTSAWYYDAVSYVYANGLMDGVSSTQFNPDGTMTRAMVWAILARIDGQTVTGDGWIETAREWAVAEGVSDGENANGAVTREQLVTMLWRYAGEPEGTAPLSAWSDAASVSDWAAEAMSWAIDNSVITGMSADTLAPQGSATRAQCAAILMRCADLLA